MTSVETRLLRIRMAMRSSAVGMPVAPRQDSLTDQLYDLWMVAAKLGMYDAADWMWKNAGVEKEA